MAKKFVRGVTGIEDIESYDKTLTNVNDILSDGQNTYVHTKKGKVESYYNLTDNLKEVLSDDSTLITVSKDDITNTTTLHPKHDIQKEQSLESTRSTVTIQKGTNGTRETTKVDTNPQKVLEHENLLTDYGISKNTSGNTTKLGLEYTKVNEGYDLNSLTSGHVRGYNLMNAPKTGWCFVDTFGDGSYIVQKATLLEWPNTQYLRLKWGSEGWIDWREQVGDKSAIDKLLTQKQNNLTSNTSIGVLSNNQLLQLYAFKNTYTHTNGILKTSIKCVAENTNINTTQEEFNFTVKINKNVNTATFSINDVDKNRFTTIFTNYGSDNTVIISGLVFSLTGSSLTVSSSTTLDENQVITFSDILN